jgi:tRNA (mo5U34)-methyltransferase
LFIDFYFHKGKNVLEELENWLESVSLTVEKNIAKNGNSAKWLSALQTLRQNQECECFVRDGRVVILSAEKTDSAAVSSALREFMPWRKGPWEILNIKIDTEWRSDLKWERFAKFLDFDGKKILDIGCGNGYYAYRAASCGAKFVLGVDPSLYSYFQSQIVASLCPQIPVKILPLSQSDLSVNLPIFDIVFSMGVFYHHKNPEEHLAHIYGLLAQNGKIVLETLIVEDEKYPDGLSPQGRYAKMRNVYLIPSLSKVQNMLEALNFKNIFTINITKTTFTEQRKTAWMDFESLEDFLDKNDCAKTVEGYPAPLRAVLLAEK